MPERTRDQPYWNYFDEMVKASTARNTAELPGLLSITDFEGKRVLDAGAGNGRVAFKVQGFCEKLTALDKNDWAIKALEKKCVELGLEQRVEIVQGELSKTGLPDAAFGIVYSLWTIHHGKENWKAIVDELNRVCAPGGVVIVGFSTEKGSIPEMEALAKENEIESRIAFLKEVQSHFNSLNGNASVKRVPLPFWFKSPKWAFEVFSETFLPKPLPSEAGEKIRDFLKARSDEKGCRLDEEIAFVSSAKR